VKAPGASKARSSGASAQPSANSPGSSVTRALANVSAPSSGEPPVTADSGTSGLEELFARQYLVDLSAAAAYRRCRPDVSEGSARVLGCQMLARPTVQARVEQLRAALVARVELKAEDVLRELKRIGFSDMRQFVTWGPGGVRLVESAQLTEDAAACVAEVSQTPGKHGSSIRFKLHDKLSALVRLGDYLKLWRQDPADRGRTEVILDPDGSVRIVTTGEA
jgi:phage terminase small subunit